jgi:hypothetical protein
VRAAEQAVELAARIAKLMNGEETSDMSLGASSGEKGSRESFFDRPGS